MCIRDRRQIDQNSCNKDYSCVNGFCPSFVTVEGERQSAATDESLDRAFEQLRNALPDADVPGIRHCYDLLVTGVGGTGVITVGALITMAAHLERKGASELDFMGFAQKFGPVLSYLRIGETPADINQVRIEKARADALIGCDLVVSSSPKASITYQRDHTRAIVNTAEMPTGNFVQQRDASLRGGDRIAAIGKAVGEQNLMTLDANTFANRLMGDTIYANVIMVGAAWQQGLVPVSLEAMLRAIELNGIRIEDNVRAFTWGRIAAHAPEAIGRLLDGDTGNVVETSEAIIQRRRDFLVGYQDEALANRYLSLVERVRDAESSTTTGDRLTTAVARAYFRLLSYKDEYEVARLHTDKAFLDRLRTDFGDKAKFRFHLAPPLLGGIHDARGRPLKREFGTWVLPLFRVLAKLRGLRGTMFDLFRFSHDRRVELQLIGEFEALVEQVLARLTAANRDELAGIVEQYLEIRGYGPVKEEAANGVREAVTQALEELGISDAEAA